MEESVKKELEQARKLIEQRYAANERYLAKQESILIHVTPEVKKEMQEKAKAEGLSMKKFIVKKCLGK